jgi:fermentation-respiration switch protein FrsA (DUF1100 family)
MLFNFIERPLVYPRPSRERGDWRPRWLRPQNVWFRAADNTKLHGWYVPNADARRLVVYCHGNGEHVADQANLVFRLQSQLAATVFVFDYRGYGRSRGKPGERGCVADGMAAQRWLAEREGVETEDIVVMGRSIGGGVAVQMAADQGARALVLENTFSRMTDAAAVLYPYLPVRLVMSNRYNSVSRIKHYHGPVFQCHGTADDMVPIELGRKLFEAAPTRLKKFFETRNGRHNDSLPPAYYTALAQFLDQVDDHVERKLPVRHIARERQLVS